MSESVLAVVDLAVEGMTCASCVARVEKKLSRLDGVQAAVNLATESAHVTLTRPVSNEELLTAVSRAGYSASVLRRTQARGRRADSASQEASPRARTGRRAQAPAAGAGRAASLGGGYEPAAVGSRRPAPTPGPGQTAEDSQRPENPQNPQGVVDRTTSTRITRRRRSSSAQTSRPVNQDRKSVV